MTDPEPQSFYDAVGGHGHVRAPRRRVLPRRRDRRGAEADVSRRRPRAAAVRLTLFLEQYWGGPTTYSEQRGHPRLRMRHNPFHIDPDARATAGSRTCAPPSTSSACRRCTRGDAVGLSGTRRVRDGQHLRAARHRTDALRVVGAAHRAPRHGLSRRSIPPATKESSCPLPPPLRTAPTRTAPTCS